MNLVDRVKNILVSPKTEWPVIAAETTDVKSMYINYILILAAIPAIAGIIGSMFGGFMTSFIGVAVLQYVMALITVFIAALVVDALAPTFGGTKNQVAALKLIAYSMTASWVAGIALVLGLRIGGVIHAIGSLYGIYLLYLGLPVMMKCPQEKVVPYLVVTVVVLILLSWVLGVLLAGAIFAPMMLMGR